MPRKKPPMSYQEREEHLWLLFDQLIRRFMQMLKNPPEEGLKASQLSTIRQFLRDNGINIKHSGRQSLSKGLTQLQSEMKLPFDS